MFSSDSMYTAQTKATQIAAMREASHAQEQAIKLTQDKIDAMQLMVQNRVRLLNAYCASSSNYGGSIDYDIAHSQIEIDRAEIALAEFNLDFAKRNLEQLRQQINLMEDPSPIIGVRLKQN